MNDLCYARENDRCDYRRVKGQQPGEEELIRCRYCTSTHYTGYLVPGVPTSAERGAPAHGTRLAYPPAAGGLDFRGKFALAVLALVVLLGGVWALGWWSP